MKRRHDVVVVGTPTRELVHATMASDLIGLLAHSPGSEWRVGFGTIIPNNRTMLVHSAAEAGASHILFIDSDMRFPADALERLLAHKKDIVGANFRQRTRDAWTARKNGEFISSEGKKGIEEVDTLGLGLTLIDMNVFVGKLRSVPPNAFGMPFDTSTGIFVGEDIYFCTVARETGFKVWVDHDLAQECKHTGSVEL